MAKAHRNNVLVTSCLKRPVDPHTRAPLASYERDEGTSRPVEPEAEAPDTAHQAVCGDQSGGEQHPDVRAIYFSNQDYYSKLEELKKVHMRTMAELESMYRRKLGLHAGPQAPAQQERDGGPLHLRKSQSAAELRRSLVPSASSEEDEAMGASPSDGEIGPLSSPKDLIKNMWSDFKLSPRKRRLSASLPGERDGAWRRGGRGPTLPEPFGMTLREEERRRRGLRTRSEVELENARLRRQLEEISECRKQFRASPVPDHVRLPLFHLLQKRRRRPCRDQECHLTIKPFSFLERERLKKEQRQQQQPPPQLRPFKAKPVPRSVYVAAAMAAVQPRTGELPHPSDDERLQTWGHRPRINKDVPDLDAAFRRFQTRMERSKEVKPTTACQPFQLRTAHIPPRRRREPASGRPYLGSPHTADSSLCSSLSGSMELLPAKDTDATKKRHQAVRQALERRKRAELEEARWSQRQKERQKTLRQLVQKRASANDPHLALMPARGHKLQEFRKQERQRRREYEQEMKEMKERVKERPLLLEQVAQVTHKFKRVCNTLVS